MDVEFAWFGGAAPVGLLGKTGIALLVFHRGIRRAQLVAEGRWPGAVDRFAIDLQPAAYRTQIILAGLRDNAFGSGPDIQQIITALADDIHQFESEILRALPVVVVLL